MRFIYLICYITAGENTHAHSSSEDQRTSLSGPLAWFMCVRSLRCSQSTAEASARVLGRIPVANAGDAPTLAQPPTPSIWSETPPPPTNPASRQPSGAGRRT